jgi:hypothetical protein
MDEVTLTYDGDGPLEALTTMGFEVVAHLRRHAVIQGTCARWLTAQLPAVPGVRVVHARPVAGTAAA